MLFDPEVVQELHAEHAEHVLKRARVKPAQLKLPAIPEATTAKVRIKDVPPGMKQCAPRGWGDPDNYCFEVKPVSEFKRHKNTPDGSRNSCKSCDREKVQRWREKNPEKAREQSRKSNQRWREKNPEKARKSRQRWREKNLGKARESVQRWREKNPEKHREQSRKSRQRWREKNPEKARESVQRWRENNLEKARESVQRWREKNPEKFRKSKQRWRENNLEKVREKDRREGRRKRKPLAEWAPCHVEHHAVRMPFLYQLRSEFPFLGHWDDWEGSYIDYEVPFSRADGERALRSDLSILRMTKGRRYEDPDVCINFEFKTLAGGRRRLLKDEGRMRRFMLEYPNCQHGILYNGKHLFYLSKHVRDGKPHIEMVEMKAADFWPLVRRLIRQELPHLFQECEA